MTDQIKETIVTNVEWNVSKDGYIKPTVVFKPIMIGGNKYERANGVNASNIVSNGIGKNARIQIIRSGDVIPNIFDVLEKTEVQMPTIKYTWGSSNKDIIAVDNSDEKYISEIVHFFKILKIKGISEKIITKIYYLHENWIDIATIKDLELANKE